MLSVGRGNEWLRWGKMAVYLRVGPRLIEGKMVQCIQLANLVTPEAYQGRGLFTEMLGHLSTTDLPIYVEQVLNRNFLDALMRRGFVSARDYDGMTWDVVLTPKAERPTTEL